jgi:hypothetical protein
MNIIDNISFPFQKGGNYSSKDTRNSLIVTDLVNRRILIPIIPKHSPPKGKNA